MGTGSARAGCSTEKGRLLGRASEPIELYRPEDDFVEQSSENIWRSVAIVVEGARRAASLKANAISGIGFDATGSLVALDEEDRPVSVSPGGNDSQNIIVSMDHRATIETEESSILENDDVLRYAGGRISVRIRKSPSCCGSSGTCRLLGTEPYASSICRTISRIVPLEATFVRIAAWSASGPI